ELSLYFIKRRLIKKIRYSRRSIKKTRYSIKKIRYLRLKRGKNKRGRRLRNFKSPPVSLPQKYELNHGVLISTFREINASIDLTGPLCESRIKSGSRLVHDNDHGLSLVT